VCRCRLVGCLLHDRRRRRGRRGHATVDGGGRGLTGRLGGLLRALLGFGLLGRGLVDDRLSTEPFGVGETTHAVRGGIVDARRVALDADLQTFCEVEDHLVLDPELPCQLIDPDLLRCQARCLLPCSAVFKSRA
jgi:hypothetical protein